MKFFITTILFLAAISAYADSNEGKEVAVTLGGMFKASYRATFAGSVDNAFDFAVGAATRSAFDACKTYPCEYCVVTSVHLDDSASGSTLSVADATVTLQGMNCRK